MNKFNSRKLLHSKWTAVKPVNKEKHFIVVEVDFDDKGQVIRCLIEAIMSKHSKLINWTELGNQAQWIQGWK